MKTIQSVVNCQTALLSVQQMGEADRVTVTAGTPATDLMDNAGMAVAREIRRRWSACPVIVLCGPGNNGGDGFVAARHLSEAGWPVRIALLGPLDRLKGAARHHAEKWCGAVEPLAPTVLDGAQLVVDAIFGAGLNRALARQVEETLAAVSRKESPVVAIDVPSGVMGDTGESWGAIPAVLTVTFFARSPAISCCPAECCAARLS